MAVKQLGVAPSGDTDTARKVDLPTKNFPPRVYAYSAPGGTPSINTDNYDQVSMSGIAAAITSMTTNLTGTPVDGQKLLLRFKDNGTARVTPGGIVVNLFDPPSTAALPVSLVVDAATVALNGS